MIVNCSFASFCQGGKLGEGYVGSLFHFFQLHWNLQLSQIKSLMGKKKTLVPFEALLSVRDVAWRFTDFCG